MNEMVLHQHSCLKLLVFIKILHFNSQVGAMRHRTFEAAVIARHGGLLVDVGDNNTEAVFKMIEMLKRKVRTIFIAGNEIAIILKEFNRFCRHLLVLVLGNQYHQFVIGINRETIPQLILLVSSFYINFIREVMVKICMKIRENLAEFFLAR